MQKAFPFLVFLLFSAPSVLIFAPHASVVYLILFLLCFSNNISLLQEKLSRLPVVFYVTTGLFLTYFLITSFWSIKPLDSLYIWIRSFSLWAMGILFINASFMLSSEKHKEYLCISFTLGCVVSLFCIMVVISSDGSFYNHLRSIFSSKPVRLYNIENLNKIAVILSFFIWPVLGFLRHYIGSKAVIFLIIALMSVIFQLESLAASLGMVLGLTTYMAILWKERRMVRLHKIIVFISFVMFFLLIYFTDPVQLIHSFSFPASAEHRLYIWKFALNTGLESPWIGWGMDMSRHIPYGLLDKVPIYNSPLPLHPHNSLLQAFLEGGVLALVIHLAFIAMLYKLMQKSRYVAEYMGLFTAALVVAMTSYSIWQFWWVAALFIAIACFNLLLKEERNDTFSLTSHK